MFTLLKWLAGLLLTLILLLSAAALIIPRVVDPNDFRDNIIKVVKEETGRDLSLDGDLSVSVFPWLGVRTQGLSFSQPGEIGASAGPMVAVDTAQLRIKLLPLMSKRLEVDTVVLEAPRLNLITLKNGVNSFTGLSGQDSKPATSNNEAASAVALVVQGIELTDGSAIWDDQQAGQRYVVSDLNIVTGNLIGQELATLELAGVLSDSSMPSPIKFEVQGKARINTASLSIVGQNLVTNVEQDQQSLKLNIGSLLVDQDLTAALKEISFDANVASPGDESALQQVTISGQVQQLVMNSVSGALSIDQSNIDTRAQLRDQPEVELAMAVPRLVFNSQTGQFNSSKLTANGQLGERPISLAVSALTGDMNSQAASVGQIQLQSKDVDARIDGLKLTKFIDQPSASAKLTVQPFDAAQLLEDFEIDFQPSDPSAMRALALNTDFSGGIDHIELKNLDVSIDNSKLTGWFSADGFEKPKLAFDLSLNTLNLDHYLPADEDGADSQSGEPATSGAEALAVPMALFKDLSANGSFRAKQLISGGLVLNDIDVDIKSTPGKVTVTPKANLYDGSLGGTMVFEERADQSVLRVKNEIDLVSLDKFLAAADVTDQLSGIGTLALDLTVTEKNGVQSNQGTIKLLATNGAIKGVDIKGIVDSGYQRYQQLRGKESQPNEDQSESQSGESEQSDETKFAELLGTFNLKDFRISNNDFSLKAPLFRVGGAGDIDLAKQSLDYTVDVSIVNSTSGQGGEALEKLKGFTLPIRFSGSLLAPRYSLDTKALYKSLLAREVEEKKSQYLQEKLGVEQGGKLSTKEILQQVLINKIERKKQPQQAPEQSGELIIVEPPQAESSAESNKASTARPQASGNVPDVQADPDAASEAANDAPDTRTEKERLKDDLKERLLEELFN